MSFALNVSGFVRLSIVANIIGVSKPTVRAMLKRGEFGDNWHTTLGGHVRVSSQAIQEYLGYDCEQGGTGGDSGIWCYARVSSKSQGQAGALTRQVDRLLREVSQREGVDPSCLNMVTDIASSFGDRKGLNRLIDAALAGNVRIIYVEFQNRLSRIPALTMLIRHLLEKANVKIMFLDKEDTDLEDKGIDVAEILDFFTVLANRQSAQKSKLVTVKHVAEATYARVSELWSGGCSVDTIRGILVSEGHTTETKQGVVCETWSEYKVREILKQINKEEKGKGKASHPFIEFCEQRLNVSPDGSFGPKDRLCCDQLYKAYGVFCKNKGIELQPKASIFQRFAPEVRERRQRSMNRTFLKGCSLV